jgi:tetratricopeptide (TPR) repeat protein
MIPRWLYGLLIVLPLALLWITTQPRAGAVSLLPEPTSTKDPAAQKELQRQYQFYSFRPTNGPLLLKIAKLLEDAGENDQALTWYEEAQRVAPSPSTQELLMTRYSWLNKPDKVLAASEKMLAGDPKNLAFLLKAAEAAEWNKNNALAGRYYERAFAVSKKNEHQEKAAERYLWANDTKNALRVFDELRRKRPRDPLLLEKMADAADYAKKPDLAISYLETAYRLAPSAAREKRLAEQLLWAGRYQEARPYFEKRLARTPSDYALLGDYADLLEGLGLATESALILDRLPLGKLPPPRLLRRAQLRLAQNRYDEALADAQTLVQSTKSATVEFRFFGAITAGEAALKLNRLEVAEPFFAYAAHIADKPQDGAQIPNPPPGARPPKGEKPRMASLFGDKPPKGFAVPRTDAIYLYQKLAEIARRQKNHRYHRLLLEKILVFDSQDVETMVTLGYLAVEEKRDNDALLYLERALVKRPGEKTLQRTLVELYVRRGDFSKAGPLLEPLFQESPDDPFLRESARELYRRRSQFAPLVIILWEDYQETPHRDALLEFCAVLDQAGHWQKTAELLLDHLRTNPFDEEVEKRLQTLMQKHFFGTVDYEAIRRANIDRHYLELIASETARLASHPNDDEARRRRAQVHLWREDPRSALPDYLALLENDSHDSTLLRQTVSTAEWANRPEIVLPLRERLYHLNPEDATNTLRIAQHYAWSNHPAFAFPYFEILRQVPSISAIERDITAFGVYQAAGRFRTCREFFTDLQVLQAAMKPVERRELARQRDILGRDIGPVVRYKSLFQHDTEAMRHSRDELFIRHQVGDGERQETTLTEHAFTQDRYDHHAFRGRTLAHTLFRQTALETVQELTFRLLQDATSGKPRFFWPSWQWSRNLPRRETRFAFTDEPLFDTPEAVYRGITLRSLHLFEAHSINNHSSYNYLVRLGQYSVDGTMWQAGIGYENIYRLDPRRGWRYNYSRAGSTADGGNVFYSPRSIGSHILAWFGEQKMRITRRLKTLFAWEFFLGKEENRSTFWGMVASFSSRLYKSIFVVAEGSAMNSSQSHFGAGEAYGQWNLNLRLEYREW